MQADVLSSLIVNRIYIPKNFTDFSLFQLFESVRKYSHRISGSQPLILSFLRIIVIAFGVTANFVTSLKRIFKIVILHRITV